MSPWVCPTCGVCWSDLFIGPCPHPQTTVAVADTVLAGHTGGCEHEWVPSDTSKAGWYCRKCGEWQPRPHYPIFTSTPPTFSVPLGEGT